MYIHTYMHTKHCVIGYIYVCVYIHIASTRSISMNLSSMGTSEAAADGTAAS